MWVDLIFKTLTQPSVSVSQPDPTQDYNEIYEPTESDPVV